MPLSRAADAMTMPESYMRPWVLDRRATKEDIKQAFREVWDALRRHILARQRTSIPST